MKDTSNYYPVSLSKSDSPIKTIYLDLDACEAEAVFSPGKDR
jgi:hypothetical protein